MEEEIMTLKDEREEWVPIVSQMEKKIIMCKWNAKIFFTRIKPAPMSQEFLEFGHSAYF